MGSVLKYLGIGLLTIIVIVCILAGVIGTQIVTAPHHHDVGLRADLAGKPVEEVSLTTDDGLVLSAWYVPNAGENAVITLCGISADRNQLVPVAEMYVQWGFAALLPDLRGTGKSQGDMVTVGYQERKDLAACVRWLRDKGYKRVGAHGFSLGAATICFAFKDVPDLGFAVVESSYDTLKSSVENRLDLVHVPHFVGWAYRLYFPYYVGAGSQSMSPIDYVPYCKCPALFLSGDSERLLTVAETTALFEKCGATRKQLHIYKGGHHEPSIGPFREEAQTTIRQFLVNEAGCMLP